MMYCDVLPRCPRCSARQKLRPGTPTWYCCGALSMRLTKALVVECGVVGENSKMAEWSATYEPFQFVVLYWFKVHSSRGRFVGECRSHTSHIHMYLAHANKHSCSADSRICWPEFTLPARHGNYTLATKCLPILGSKHEAHKYWSPQIKWESVAPGYCQSSKAGG